LTASSHPSSLALAPSQPLPSSAPMSTPALCIPSCGGIHPPSAPRSSAPQFGFTALLVAAENAHLDVVRALLAAGADASVHNKASTHTRQRPSPSPSTLVTPPTHFPV
jgi:hypothetical protein